MIESLVGTLVGPIENLLGKFIQDKDKRAQLAHDIATLSARQAHERDLAQIGVNKQEAAHQSLFVAGWRPAAGWCCVSGMAMNYLVIPAVDIVSALAGMDVYIEPLDLSVMLPVLAGMLGIGWLRTDEKKSGVARSSL